MRIEKFLDSTPLFTLFVAYDEIIGDFQKRLAKEGVHFLQALVLTGLFFEERPVRPSELTKSLRARKSNLSHALRSLEKAGLIERKTVPADARAYMFTLTREGRRRVPKLIKIFDSAQNQIEAVRGSRKLNPSLRLFMEIYAQVVW
jgi:DNA-binding MarR family transcriptional regulator